MLATVFHDRVSLAILGGMSFGLALVIALSQVNSPCGAAPDEVIEVDVVVPAAKPTINCRESTTLARQCAHALHMSRQTEKAAELLWSVVYPCCHSGPEFRVHKGIRTNGTWNEAYVIRDLASDYDAFVHDLVALELTDPLKAYWPLPGLRKSDLELGGAYAVEIDARLREMAPRAANHYAKGKTDGDCINYSEPAAIAKELGIPVDPPANRCRRVRR